MSDSRRPSAMHFALLLIFGFGNIGRCDDATTLAQNQKDVLKKRSESTNRIEALWNARRYGDALSLGESILEANREMFGDRSRSDPRTGGGCETVA